MVNPKGFNQEELKKMGPFAPNPPYFFITDFKYDRDQEFGGHFDPKGWCEASVHLPEKIIKILEKNPEKYDLSKIKILEKLVKSKIINLRKEYLLN